MWKNRILYLITLSFSLAAYIAADRKEILVLIFMLAAIPLMLLIIQLLAMRRVKIKCSAGNIYRLGQTVCAVISIEKSSRLPMGIVCINMTLENILFAKKKNVMLELNIDEEKAMDFEYFFPAENCGVVRISFSNAQYYDLSGLFRWKINICIKEEIHIYPPELRINAELSRQPKTNDFSEMYDRHKKGSDVNEVADLRDYIKGDSMNSIHWKLSGKFDRLIVREFGSPSGYNTLILYEMAKSSKGIKISDSCNNAVLAITMSLSCSIIKMGLEHNVGRINKGELRTMPVNSLSTHKQMAKNLLYMPVSDEKDAENSAFLFLNNNIDNNYTKIIYVTPVYDDESIKQKASNLDIMVIHIVEGRKPEYVKRAGYEIFLINADDYQSSVHNIIL